MFIGLPINLAVYRLKDIKMAAWCHEMAYQLGVKYDEDMSLWREGCASCTLPDGQ